jgi:hypothetical protein
LPSVCLSVHTWTSLFVRLVGSFILHLTFVKSLLFFALNLLFRISLSHVANECAGGEIRSVADSVCACMCVSVSAYACVCATALLAQVEAELGQYGLL